jgi:hypothetical protein
MTSEFGAKLTEIVCEENKRRATAAFNQAVRGLQGAQAEIKRLAWNLVLMGFKWGALVNIAEGVKNKLTTSLAETGVLTSRGSDGGEPPDCTGFAFLYWQENPTAPGTGTWKLRATAVCTCSIRGCFQSGQLILEGTYTGAGKCTAPAIGLTVTKEPTAPAPFKTFP